MKFGIFDHMERRDDVSLGKQFEERLQLLARADELGFYGYPDVYETPEGNLRICDGHLRKDLLLAKYGVSVQESTPAPAPKPPTVSPAP